uniref:Putative glucan endo-1,3-beta-glucosidase n=1 Tax=Davidia involucrata TaxID=16924 RepID=A0A5B7BBK7_DAVIN
MNYVNFPIGLQKTWCVAKPSSDQATLTANINYACSQVDCRVLQRGCPCFSPDNLVNHASIAMNLYYQSRGRNRWNCDFRNSALIVMTCYQIVYAYDQAWCSNGG